MVGRLAHRALDLLVALVADQDDRVALGGELLRLHVDLRHERAGGVDRRAGRAPRRSRAPPGATPWAEKTTVSPSGTSVSSSTKIGAALAQLLDHVLVVDDLLAHVDGRPVQLERALDRLDRAVHAGAVAARGGEQQLLGGGGHRRAG